MGKQQSKPQEEQIIIAQNGAGNSAAASEVEQQIMYRYETYSYLLFIIACILAAMLYLFWKRCKMNYARYMRRELRDLPMVELQGGNQRPIRGPPPQPPRVII